MHCFTLATTDPAAWLQALGRFHVAIVHFPIALLILAACVELVRMARRKSGPSPISVACLIVGMISAIVAAAAGWFHKDYVSFGGQQAAVLDWHQWMGLAATALAAAAAIALIFRGTRGAVYRAATVTCAILVIITSHLGGTLTHGPGYLTELLTTPRPTGPVGDVITASLVTSDIPLETVSFPADGKVDFIRHVQPILAHTCYECHGPSVRRGDLRLDNKPSVLTGGNSGKPAIIPGDSEQSLLIRRVRGLDHQKQMPLGHEPLSDEHVKILGTWIDQGAHWPDDASNEHGEEQIHWAFIKPQRPNLPAVQDTSWPRNAIDFFVLAKLEAEGLSPSPEADRATLIRRVSLDLTGLPPTPQEVDDFVNDTSYNAYDKVVDRLLASPHYGERWARHWLDLARYADTNGYEKDRPRQIWAYRDWVINAFNNDMPFDQFTIEQIAGDMLPDATQDQLIATGFHRNTMFNEEGGIDVEEFRYASIVDRVQTTATTFLGLTMHCAQCHTHKYDPVTHTEYFQFFAFLNNADEPDIELISDEITAKRKEIDEKIAALTGELHTHFPHYEQVTDYEVLTADAIKAKSNVTLTRQEDGSYLAGDAAPDTDVYTFEVTLDGDRIGSLKLEAMGDESLPQKGPGRAGNGNFVLSEIVVSAAPTSGGKPQPVKIVNAEADYQQPGFPITDAFNGKSKKDGWAVSEGAGGGGKHRTATFRFAEPLPVGPVKLVIRLDQNYGGSHVIGRLRLSAGRDRAAPESDLPIEQQRENFLIAKLTEWETDVASKAVQWTTLDPVRYWRYHGATITKLPDRSLLFTGDNLYRDIYDIEFVTDQRDITAIRVEVLPHDDLPKNGPGRNENGGFRMAEFLAAAATVDQIGPAAPLKIKSASASPESGNSIALAIDAQKDTHWTLPAGNGKPQTAVFHIDGKIESDGPVRLSLSLVQNFFQSENLGRVRISVTSDARESIETPGVPAEIESILATAVDQRNDAQKAQLRQYFLSVTPLLAGKRAELDQLRASRPAAPTTMVMKEREQPRITRLHHRGEWINPREEVQPAVPAVLHQLPEDAPRNRLTFAKWLVDEDNPLIGRVTMNRIWSHYFGRGIVESVADFGIMGDEPSHPELLDWLATELPRQDWSLKAMHRLIVTSATYRQSSHVTPLHLEKDPNNVLLARMPRLRVEAETIRDVALAAAGMLNPQVGGPSVYPPQPPGVSELSYGPLKWPTSDGPDRYRRGMYTFLKRTSLYPGLVLFDAPTTEMTCARRIRSNTPLQALTTLNDEVFVEAAQGLAQRIVTEGPPDAIGRAELAFRLCVARQPTRTELEKLIYFYQRQLARFRTGSADAQAVALLDPSKAPEGADLPELAAWTTVARVILNLDETVTKE